MRCTASRRQTSRAIRSSRRPGSHRPTQVLDRFIAAIGGAQRVAALTSLTAKGTYIGFDDAEKSADGDCSRGRRASGRRLFTALPAKTVNVFDGRNGWIAAPPTDKPVPLLAITGQELEGVRLETQLLFPARIKESLARLASWCAGNPRATAKCVLVQGDTPGGGVATLCFDMETGLLVRLVRYTNSPVGRLVTRVDYDDYRDVAGVKLPFRWTVRWLSGRSTYELTDVQPNVQVADARFAQPRP